MKAKKIIFTTIYLLVGLFLFTACNNDDDYNDTQDISKQRLPQKTYYHSNKNSTTETYYYYDGNKRFTRIYSEEKNINTSSKTTQTFSYNGDNLIKITTEYLNLDGSGKTISQRIKTTNFNQDGSTINVVTDDNAVSLTVDGKGKTISYTYLPDTFISYNYDAAGNVTSATYNIPTKDKDGNIIYKKDVNTFEYDNYNGIFKNVKMPQWYWLYAGEYSYSNNRNIVISNSPNPNFAILYEYDNLGYPIKQQNSGNNTSYMEIEY